MVSTGPVIQAGQPSVGPAVTLVSASIGPPLSVSSGATGGGGSLENLSNVQADDAPTDSVLVKSADGNWRPRPALTAAAIDSAIAVHVIDPTPHPAYDDMPSLRLLYENGLI